MKLLYWTLAASLALTSTPGRTNSRRSLPSMRPPTEPLLGHGRPRGRDCFVRFEPPGTLTPAFIQVQQAPGLKMLQEFQTMHLGNKINYQTMLQMAPEFRLDPNFRKPYKPPGMPYRHELRSMAKFAKIFKRDYGESLGMLTSFDGVDNPGYDGVLMNKDGRVFANFSLKNVFGAGIENALSKAIRKGIKYMQPKAWEKKYEEEFDMSERWLENAPRLFGVTSNEYFRPFRVLMEIESQISLPTKTQIAEYQAYLQSLGGRVQSIVIIKEQRYLTITSSSAFLRTI